jgi:hypothetical protein
MIYRGVHPLAPKQTRASATSETAAKCEGEETESRWGNQRERDLTEYWQDCEHGEIPDATASCSCTYASDYC